MSVVVRIGCEHGWPLPGRPLLRMSIASPPVEVTSRKCKLYHDRANNFHNTPRSHVACVLPESQVVSRNNQRTDVVRDGQRPATWGRVRSDSSKGWRYLQMTCCSMRPHAGSQRVRVRPARFKPKCGYALETPSPCRACNKRTDCYCDGVRLQVAVGLIICSHHVTSTFVHAVAGICHML